MQRAYRSFNLGKVSRLAAKLTFEFCLLFTEKEMALLARLEFGPLRDSSPIMCVCVCFTNLEKTIFFF